MSENVAVEIEKHPPEYTPGESTQPAPEPSPTDLLLKEKTEIEAKLRDFETRQRIAETKGVRPLSEKMDSREWAKTREEQIAHGLTLNAEEGEKLREELGKLDGKLTQQVPSRDAQGRFAPQQLPPLTPDLYHHQPTAEHISNYVKQVNEIAASREDAQEVFERSEGIILAPEVGPAILALGNAAIAYHLADHPELVAKLNRLSGAKLSAELGRIEAAMDSDDADTKAKPPKPPTPTGRNPTKTSRSVYDEDLPWKEFVKLRNEQERKADRRF